MKKQIKSSGVNYEEPSFVMTSSGLLTLLSQIDELKNLDIELSIDEEGWSVQIGDSTYIIENPTYSEIKVSEDAIEEISELDQEGWEDLENEIDEPVEGGLIKEVLKTLAVGGLVRLTKDAIMKS